MKNKPKVVIDNNAESRCFKNVQELLQLAVKLELFTLPIYMYTYYSLINRKSHVGVHIREVIMEEMLHMAIISNIMHALKNCKSPAYSPIRELENGEPYTEKLVKKYVPFYPGTAPIYKADDEESVHRKFVEKAAVLSLDSLSLDQIVAFLRLELPELKHNIAVEDWETIGEFYEYVKKQLLRCPNLEFHPSEQIDLYTHNPTKDKKAIRSIRNLKDALDSIDFIVEQGEGATFYNLSKHEENFYHRKNNPEGEKPELAHFYHFLIIYELMGGKEEFHVNTETFDEKEFLNNFDPNNYERFQKENVIKIVKNPSEELSRYPAEALEANNHFNSNYSNLLDALTYASLDSHRLNFGIALQQMTQFDALADAVTKFTLKDDPTSYCGPTFEYIEPSKRS